MAKKKIIYTVIGLILIICSIVGVIICQKSKLTHDEQWALDCVQDLKSMMNDEDSFRLEDDIVIIDYADGYGVNVEKNKYTYISYSANNGYGARMKGVAMYKGFIFVGKYDDDSDEIEDIEETETLLKAQIALSSYHCGKLKETDSVYIIDKNRIEKKIK